MDNYIVKDKIKLQPEQPEQKRDVVEQEKDLVVENDDEERMIILVKSKQWSATES